jgi:hypothetical protein
LIQVTDLLAIISVFVGPGLLGAGIALWFMGLSPIDGVMDGIASYELHLVKIVNGKPLRKSRI